MVKVLFVCLGNICRSPMAEFILKDIVKKRGLENEFIIDSAATSGYNEKFQLGIYPEAKDILKKRFRAVCSKYVQKRMSLKSPESSIEEHYKHLLFSNIHQNQTGFLRYPVQN